MSMSEMNATEPVVAAPVVLSRRVQRWRDAWQNLHAARVAALYRHDASHASGAVRAVMPGRADGILRGLKEIAAYADSVCQRVQAMDFEILQVEETADHSFVEYRRTLNGDAAKAVRVMEVLRWDGELLAAVRVYHF